MSPTDSSMHPTDSAPTAGSPAKPVESLGKPADSAVKSTVSSVSAATGKAREAAGSTVASVRALLRSLTGQAEGSPPPSARAYLLAWRALRAMPASQAYLLGALAADAAVRRRGAGVRRLEANLTAIGVERGALAQVTRAAMRSYLRYWVEVFRLPSWSTEQILASVRTVGDEPVREALAEGRGVVMALAHQGNWDLAGAWSTHALAHVTTVAERLEPPEVFEQFTAFRTDLGMTVHAVGEPGLLRSLTTALEHGHIVPLLADRDLTGAGVDVTFAGHPARFGTGPALLADLTGAALVPVSIAYEMVRVNDEGWPESGWRTVIQFHPEVKLDAAGSRSDRVRAAMQACADALAAGVQARPADWHMLQPVFGDVGYPGAKASPAAPPGGEGRDGEGPRPAGRLRLPRLPRRLR